MMARSGFSARAAATSFRYSPQMRGRCPTTSSSPTTDKLAASTTVRTPAARSRGPVQPKQSRSPAARRSSAITSEAYRSPEASPADTRIFRVTRFQVYPAVLIQSMRAMAAEMEGSRLTVDDLAARFRGQMIPLTAKFSYFSTLPVAEDEIKQYLNDPIAALSPALVASLPQVGVILAPYLERGNGKEGDAVRFERPAESRYLGYCRRELGDWTVFAFGIKDGDVAEYHYRLYNALAALAADRWGQDVQERFFRAIREELSAEVHGEVDEKGWHLKQA